MGRRFEDLDWYRSQECRSGGIQSGAGLELGADADWTGREGAKCSLPQLSTENDEVRVTRHSSSLRISSQQISFPAKSACTAGATTDSQYLG